MLRPRYARQFKKDIQKIERSGRYDLEKFKIVAKKLIGDTALENTYLDHALTGNLRGYRDCHIEPDWLLIYKIDRDAKEITFVRTGSHSDLFG